MSVLALCQALPLAASQCRPMSAVVAESTIVFVGQPRALLRRGALVVPEPRLAGTPGRYDLVRFAVVGAYRGATIDAVYDLLCPTADRRCVVGTAGENHLLLIALPAAPTAAVPQTLFCRMADAQASADPSDSDAPRLRALLEGMLARPQAR